MRYAILALGLMVLASAASADTLLVERAKRDRGAGLPNKGMTMSAVETQFGAPTQRMDAVGQPPITRWVYGAFTVYFEGSKVIHAVLSKSSKEEMGPKPVSHPKN